MQKYVPLVNMKSLSEEDKEEKEGMVEREKTED